MENHGACCIRSIIFVSRCVQFCLEERKQPNNYQKTSGHVDICLKRRIQTRNTSKMTYKIKMFNDTDELDNQATVSSGY